MSAPFRPELNDVYEHIESDADGEQPPPRYVRVLAFSGNSGAVAVIQVPGREALPEWQDMAGFRSLVEDGKLELRRPDPLVADARATSDLTEAERSCVQARWRTIQALVEDPDQMVLWPEHRGQLILQACTRLGVCKSTIYNNLRTYWQYGQFPNALTPRLSRCGGRGKVRVFSGVRPGRDRVGDAPRAGVLAQDFDTVILDCLPWLDKKVSLPSAREKVLLQHFGRQTLEDGKPQWTIPREDQMPTVRQFRYRLNALLGRGAIARRQMGETVYRKDFAPKAGTLHESVSGPGVLYQMDSTLCDILLKSAYSSLLVGRPVLYLVVDVYSSAIVGFHVGLKPPSVREMRLCIENALTDKVPYYASLGRVITDAEAPFRHRPGRLLSDGGSEMTSEYAAIVGNDLGFSVSTAPPYSPTAKGLCEGKFALMDVRLLTWQPGVSFRRERGDKPCPLDGAYTLSEFRQLMALWILEHNARRVKRWPRGWVSPDGRDPTRLEAWDYGCRINGKPETIDSGLVRTVLLERDTGKIGQTGITFNRRLYRPVNDVDLRMLEKLPGGRFGRVPLRNDARDISEILVTTPDRRLSQWVLHNDYTAYRGWTEDEWEFHEAWKLIGNRTAATEDIARLAPYTTAQQVLARAKVAEGRHLRPVKGRDGMRIERKRELLLEAAGQRASTSPVPMPKRTSFEIDVTRDVGPMTFT